METAPLIIAGLMTVIFAQIVYLIARRSAGKLKLRATKEAETENGAEHLAPEIAAFETAIFPQRKVNRRTHAAMVNAIRAQHAGKTSVRSSYSGRMKGVKTDQQTRFVVTEENGVFGAFVKP